MLLRPTSIWMNLQKRGLFFPWGHTTKESIRSKQVRRERQRFRSAPTIPGLHASSPSSTKDQILLEKGESSHELSSSIHNEKNLTLSKDEEYQAYKRNYLPSRIDDELAVFHDPTKGPYMERTSSQWVKKLWKKPFPSIMDYDFYVQEERKKNYTRLIKVQLLDEDRLTSLGPDLAAAWFLLSRNCKIKFKDHDEWMEVDFYGRIDRSLPSSYERGYYLESIEASRSVLVYEGLQNLRNLHFLKYLDISYCENVDEWFIDRIAGEYRETLEYLDISGCYRLDWNGIEPLARFKNLKVLVLRDLDHIEDLKLICLLLLEINPDLDVRGVDYIDIELLKDGGNEGLIEDFEKDLLLLQEKGINQ